jgi:hypothetical protein
MKNIKIVSILFLFAILGNACNKDCNNTPTSSTSEPISGSWRINSFIKDSVDLTNQFNGYNMNCNNNGRMMVQGNGSNYSSAWKWNDANHTICNFRIMGCDKNSVLLEMDNDWDFTNIDSNHCQFSINNNYNHINMTWIKN